jgi:hypothetical protein
VKYAVKVDQRIRENHVEGSRRGEELDAIRQLLDRTAPADREAVRRVVESPFATFSDADDPESARLLGVIRSIREADAAARSEKNSASSTSLVGDMDGRLSVSLALTPSGEHDDGAARIIRRPNDQGIPLVVLPEASTTDESLAEALRIALRSVDQYGTSPKRATTITLKRNAQIALRPGKPIPADWRAALAVVRQAPVGNVQGLGPVRAATVRVSRDR